MRKAAKIKTNKKAVLPQENRAMLQVFFSVKVHIFTWISNIQRFTLLYSASRQSHALIYI